MGGQTDTVLLTGISGFVAKHVARELLVRGFRVRGTVRTAARVDAVRTTLSAAGADVSRLEFVEADLTRDAGWDEAADGCRFVIHTASPFPSVPPRDKFGLVGPAVEGTRRVVRAAQRGRVERLVLTSSVVAIYHGHEGRQADRFTEADVSNVDSPDIYAYAVSKTLAERAAWEAVQGSALELSVINPSLVLGPVLDADYGASVGLVADMMKGRIPLAPDARFGVVDVRDVAHAHVEAMLRPEAAGRRFIVTDGSMSVLEIANAIGAFDPRFAGRVPKRQIPTLLIRLAARVSRRAAMLAVEVGSNRVLDNTAARTLLGVEFRPRSRAVEATVASLLKSGAVEAR